MGHYNTVYSSWELTEQTEKLQLMLYTYWVSYFLKNCICSFYVDVCVWVSVCHSVCEFRGKTVWIWVQGIELSCPGLVTRAITHWAVSPASYSFPYIGLRHLHYLQQNYNRISTSVKCARTAGMVEPGLELRYSGHTLSTLSQSVSLSFPLVCGCACMCVHVCICVCVCVCLSC